jgi:solute carrier family 34 (sodium-dependent phosphate cotransporter)
VLFFPDPYDAILQVLMGMGLIFFSIYFLGKVLKRLMVGKAKEIMNTAIGRGPVSEILSGIFMTILVQSSKHATAMNGPTVV